MTIETITKPWGKEEILERNECYVLKRLTMELGKRCSLQYHNLKTETIYVLSGKLHVAVESRTYNLGPGDTLTIKPKEIHRMQATGGYKYAEYLECSTPHLEDVIRLEDDYGRI